MDNEEIKFDNKEKKNAAKAATMGVGDTIKLNNYTYQLTQCKPCDNKCEKCIFGDADRCCLLDDDNTLRDKADDLTANCTRIAWGVYRLVEPKHDNSSTGGESQSNIAPIKLSDDTKRSINVVLTLGEARRWYNSHNLVLKDLACRAFTLAELEDVRRCTMNVDIETAKRLYRNAENAVRDFVLSAFSREELEN